MQPRTAPAFSRHLNSRLGVSRHRTVRGSTCLRTHDIMTSFTHSVGGKDLSNLYAFELSNDYTHNADYDNRPIACFSLSDGRCSRIEHELRWSNKLTFIRAFCCRSLAVRLLARVRRPSHGLLVDGTGRIGSSVCLLRRLFSSRISTFAPAHDRRLSDNWKWPIFQVD